MSKTAYIDGDIVVYQAGFASDTRYYSILNLDDDSKEVAQCQYKRDAEAYVHSSPISTSLRIEKGYDFEPLKNCLHSVNQMIQSITRKSGCNKYVVILSGSSKDNYRLKVDPQYKANRDSSHKPHWATEIRDYLVTHHDARVTAGIEADDLLGIEGYNNDDVVICSNDKDLLTIPGNHYNWRNDVLRTVNAAEADHFFWTQMLTGDTVDNIKGVPNVGKVKAGKLLDHLTVTKDLERTVLDTYRAHFPETYKEEFSKNYKLLYILRDEGEIP